VDESEERHRRPPGDHDQRDQSTLTTHPRDPSGYDRHHERPGAGRGVEQTDCLWSAVVQRERDRGEERAGQPEDHGVEVHEVDRLDHRVGADVAKAVADGSKHGGAGVLSRRGQRGEGNVRIVKTPKVIASMA